MREVPIVDCRAIAATRMFTQEAIRIILSIHTSLLAIGLATGPISCRKRSWYSVFGVTENSDQKFENLSGSCVTYSGLQVVDLPLA